MRQEFANTLAIISAVLILVLSVAFALIQSAGADEFITRPADGSAQIAPEGTAQVNAETGLTLVTASVIPHRLVGLENCQNCHARDARAPFPPSHVGWPNVFCAACHAPTTLE